MVGPEAAGRRFRHIAAAGIFFQGAAAAVDTGTIVAALVQGLTGNPAAVGAAAAISRYGWLFPQLFIGYFAQNRRRRLPFYSFGAFGRVGCLLGVAAIVAASGPAPGTSAIALFFMLWTLYAFVGGILAVPYNDIVARAVPSARRSRLLAIRFFGGGMLALAVASTAHRLLGIMPFPEGHAAVLGLGAGLLLLSALAFVTAGEPEAPPSPQMASFGTFLKDGLAVYRTDRRFRLFVGARWLEGAAAMALPFYVVAAAAAGITAAEVAILLGAQTAGQGRFLPIRSGAGGATGSASSRCSKSLPLSRRLSPASLSPGRRPLPPRQH
jgi:MFS family permease